MVDLPATHDPLIPLRLHASYLSAEVGAAFDARTVEGGLRPFYTGVETATDTAGATFRGARRLPRPADRPIA